MIAVLKRLRLWIGDAFLCMSLYVPALRKVLSRVLYSFTKQKLMPLAPLSCAQATQRGILIANQKTTTKAPTQFQTAPRAIEITFPDIQFRNFQDTTIAANSAGLIQQDRFYLPDELYENRHRVIANSYLARTYTPDSALIQGLHRTNALPKGIFMAGLGSFNWYHWLVEILPKAVLFKNLPAHLQTYPILVPPEFDRFPTYRQAFEALGLNNEVIVLQPYQTYQVADLIYIDAPSVTPFNMRSGFWPKLADSYNNTDVLLRFRDKVLASLKMRDAPPHRRIFLARSNTRRDYDQAALIEMLAGMGVETVYTDKMDFQGQVKLLREAKLVIGPSGAAWANMLFAQKETQGVIWSFPEYDEIACYSNIAAMVGVDLHYLFFPATIKPSTTHDLYNASYDIDFPALKNAIRVALAELGSH